MQTRAAISALKSTSVGQITLRILRDLAARMSSKAAKTACAEKLISRDISTQNDQLRLGGEIFLFRFFGNCALLRASCFAERGVRAVVTIRGAGMRWT
jgi:hypothetical protein